jgi:hypothetical protein
MKMAIFLLSLALNAWLGYRVLNLGVTITHQSDQILFLNSQVEDVEKLWTKHAERSSSLPLIEAAKQVGLEVIEKKSERAFYLGRIKVLLTDDRVAKIVLRE